MTDPVRWGVLGNAAIARNKLIPAIQRASNSEMLGIASRDADRAAEAAGALGIARSYGSYDALLGDDDIDAVYNPLPNSMHAEWTLKAAAAGKHILCEKPLAMNEAEAVTMVEGCREAGVLLMEAFMYRLHPVWAKVRELVGAGRIGELLAVHAFFSYNNTDPANIRNVADLGGGALMDIGCYPISVARMMFGSEPTDVQAVIRRDPRFDTDVLTSAVLDFDGRQATFTCSTQLSPDQRAHLIGSEGKLLVEIPFNIPSDRPSRLHLSTAGSAGDEVIEISAVDQYQVQVEQFAAAVRDGTPPPIPAEDAIANMAVIDRVFAAARR